MELSRSIDRDRHNLHPVSPMVFQMEKVKWDIFGSLTFRVVPPNHIQRRCVFEFIRRFVKKFTYSEDQTGQHSGSSDRSMEKKTGGVIGTS